MSFGTLILVTIYLFIGNGEPKVIQRFIYPNSLELDASDKAILDSLTGNKVFSLFSMAAEVTKIENMITPKQIGDVVYENGVLK